MIEPRLPEGHVPDGLMLNKPKYIIKVRKDWRYGPRAKFWDIQEWKEVKGIEGGYWGSACRGGLAYTEWGMWRAINKRLKKMKFGYSVNYFSLDKEPIQHPNCSNADTDTCPPNDANCIWRTVTCRWCNQDYKVSQRALTGKYMISDHNKTCKEYKKQNRIR